MATTAHKAPLVTKRDPTKRRQRMATTAHKAPLVTKRDPTKTIGLETGVNGSYTYSDAPPKWLRNRTVTLNGVAYEHTREDGDGCWIYRQQPH